MNCPVSLTINVGCAQCDGAGRSKRTLSSGVLL